MAKNKFRLTLVITTLAFAQALNAGVVIKSQYAKKSETIIYQNGVAVFLQDGFANFIVNTHTNNCIAINHELKTYLFVSCAEFQAVVKILENNKKVEFNTKIPITVKKLTSGNLPLENSISIKKFGKAMYQGQNIEKFQFIVNSEVVSEYWMSDSLQKKIDSEVDTKKIEKIFNVSNANDNITGSLNDKIKKKYNEFKKGRVAVKEFRYTGSRTKKLFKDISFKRVAIKKYMPPKSYKVSSTLSGFFSIQ